MKHIRFSTSRIIRELDIVAGMKYHSTPPGWLKRRDRQQQVLTRIWRTRNAHALLVGL